MNKFWLALLKPRGAYARWLIFLSLVAIIGLGFAGQLDSLRAYLDTDELTFSFGQFSISAYQALRALVILVLIFWVAAIVSDIFETRIERIERMRSATRALAVKIVQISIYAVAFILGLDVIGVDLTTLTIFSGALGIGLGFGLQKISSNFISGLILLIERSMEQEDLIELPDGTLGFVKQMRARYTLIETFDTKEILVPNEDFITNRVTNWTLTNKNARIEIAVGVSYASDIEKARDLMLEAALEHPACIDQPKPACFLRNYGDSSVDFILHFWVADVTLGRWRPQSEVMFAIWRKFKDNDIQIPFPQRDVHIRSAETIPVKQDG